MGAALAYIVAVMLLMARPIVHYLFWRVFSVETEFVVTAVPILAAVTLSIALIVLHGALSWIVLAVAWTGAATGVALSLGYADASRLLVVGSYLSLGWLAVIALPQMLEKLRLTPLLLLAGGGLLYSAGAVIYAVKRPNPWPRTFGFHEIFHTLVIAAAVLQWIVITHWVLQTG